MASHHWLNKNMIDRNLKLATFVRFTDAPNETGETNAGDVTAEVLNVRKPSLAKAVWQSGATPLCIRRNSLVSWGRSVDLPFD